MQVDEAQQESERAYATARDAQRRANDAARAADRATRDAQQKQLVAEQAQQHAIQLQQEAQAAQRQAVVAGEEAAKRAQAAQQRALELDPRAQAQLNEQGPRSEISGTLESASDRELVIARPSAPPVHVTVDPQRTTALQAGKNVPPSELQHGAPVTVQYRIENGRRIAEIVAQDVERQPPPNGKR